MITAIPAISRMEKCIRSNCMPPVCGRQSIGDLDLDQSKRLFRNPDTQDEANRIGSNATAVNNVESRSEIAPSLSH